MSVNKILKVPYSSTYHLTRQDVEIIVSFGRKVYSEFPEREYVLNKLDSLLMNHGIFWNKVLEVSISDEDKRQAKLLFPELY